MGLREVSNILWRERHLLELLLFKLEEEQLLLASGRSRWLARATSEVEMVMGEIRQVELARAIELDAATVSMGLGAGVSLKELAEKAPPPWNGLFLEHHRGFLEITDEIASLARINRELLARGFQATREALMEFDEERVSLYSPTGRTSERVHQALLIDEVL
ncbi:MAG: flagellar export chaperone FlgN [Acidimicrobiales bacterium]